MAAESWSRLAERYFTGPQHDAAVAAVRRYHDAIAGVPAFTGAWFNSWPDPETASASPDVVTSDDVVAVQFLSMRPKSLTLWQVLTGRRDDITAVLQPLPIDVPLWEATRDQLDAAGRAYSMVRSISGAGDAFTSKLLARKRPLLMPVYDSVVSRVTGRGAFREPLAQWMRQDAHRSALQAIREAADVPALPLLRVFDIVVWMAERTSEPESETGAEDSIPLPTEG